MLENFYIKDYNDFILESFDYKIIDPIHEDYLFTEKENIISKIWNKIKSIFEWMGKIFSKFMNFIKSLFVKNKRTPEDILMNMKIKPIGLKYMNESTEDVISSIKKPFFFKFDNNEMILIYDSIYKDNDKIKVSWSILSLLFMNKDVDYMNLLCTTLIEFNKNKDVSKLKKNYEIINKYFENSMNLLDLNRNKFGVIKLTYKSIQNISNIILKMNMELARIENIDVNINELDKNSLDMLFYIQQRVMNAQTSLNYLLQSLRLYNTVSDTFKNSISDLNTLDIFVWNMIKSGYDYSNLIENIKIVYNEEFAKSKDGENDKRGMGRFVLFPKNNKSIVYKIAYNGFGIKSNLSELQVYEHNKNIGNPLPLADIKDSTDNGIILSIENLDGGESLSTLELENFKAKVASLNILGKRHISDLSKSNVKKINGKIKLIDYGFIRFG